MGLKNLRLPTLRVEVPGGEEEQFFAVRGVNLVDIRALLVKHSSEMARLFDVFANGGEVKLDPESIAAAASSVAGLINQAPALVADLIAMASGEEDAFEQALALPFPVQVDALTKIGKLTFASEDSAKKFLQTASSLIGLFKGSQNG
ncbi:tail protein [Burkholderia phage vB_BceS_AH2]|uniref:Tail protein n=1 Tax=Burkholderia phage vB_BceS_AH2 TaxID=1133022 RepID=I6NLJ1_9CAUD|nr:tail length tape measure protein [Burkholderia phage vB_BceS_AH2]AEY69565.1 tail protein [Burkholderia phage vB_BceS_AH2]